MAKINRKPQTHEGRTHEGAPAKKINAEQKLRRAVMASFLFEKQFYESGETIYKRIQDLVPQVKPETVADIAIEAREKMKLRHIPMVLVREMARHDKHKVYVARTLERIIQRADELSEFLALYWSNIVAKRVNHSSYYWEPSSYKTLWEVNITKTPIANQIKKGLARAFCKFDEYQLAKYNRDATVKLRDVLFLCHAKPESREQAILWKKLVDDNLSVPNTWETRLSGGQSKKEVFTDLLTKGKLGALALLRNLRNMQQAGVDESVIRTGLQKMNVERVLPFRFITAAKYAPRLESDLETAMFKCLKGIPKLPGKTVLLVDTSGSMDMAKVSEKSDLTRRDAAAALAMLAREVCEEVQIYTFTTGIRSCRPRRGFALRDEIMRAPSGGTQLGNAIVRVNHEEKSYDRIIVFTDEQSADRVGGPIIGSKGYMINVASCENGVGYGSWVHIDGFSEAAIAYIQEYESRKLL